MTKELLLALLLATGAYVPADGPRNVSPDPKGAEIPKCVIPPKEKPTGVFTVEKVQTTVDEDYVDYGLKNMKASDAWAKGITGKGVKVTILDTGIATKHRDLAAGIKGGKDFTGKGSYEDGNGHGTHCAGIIGARKNGWGVVGVAYDVDLYAGKVLSDQGSGGVDDIAAGLTWAEKTVGTDVISMSLGGGGADDFMPPALASCEAAGILVFAAAGNDGNGRPVNYPGAYKTCIAVSAVDSNNKIATFSCTGAKVEVCGPGVNVRSTYPGPGDGLFADLSGTSMATPNIAGWAALWIQANPQIAKKDRPAKFREALATLALDLPPVGRDTFFGWGLPQADKLSVTPVPPVPPVTPAPGLILDENDLTPAALKKLKDAGFNTFKLELRLPTSPPPAAPVPTVTPDALETLVRAKKKALVLVGIEGSLADYPGAVRLAGPVEGVPAGVYVVEIEEVLSFTPIPK